MSDIILYYKTASISFLKARPIGAVLIQMRWFFNFWSKYSSCFTFAIRNRGNHMNSTCPSRNGNAVWDLCSIFSLCLFPYETKLISKAPLSMAMFPWVYYCLWWRRVLKCVQNKSEYFILFMYVVFWKIWCWQVLAIQAFGLQFPPLCWVEVPRHWNMTMTRS